MTDQKEKKEKLAPKTLQLTRTVETGQVQQTFAPGRSKTVTVEVKKTRTFSRDGKPSLDQPKKEILENEDTSSLTRSEMEARLQAVEKSGSTKRKAIEPPTYKEKKQEDIVEEEAKEEFPPSADDVSTQKSEKSSDTKKKFFDDELKLKTKKPKFREEKKSKAKLTVTNALDADEGGRERSLASIKRARQKAKRQHGEQSPAEKTVREITIPENIVVQELANRMAVRIHDVVKELMKLGIMAKPSQQIDADTAEIIVTEFGHKFKRVTDADVEDVLINEEIVEEDLEPRAPVVTIMGHVDHGKTSLLDALRSSTVAKGEHGGITQHIGAYQIETGKGDLVTFLDTPGHAAFTAMRARGAKVTDIVILVVAADDGVMPQTIEAINHAKAAEVPIIVAINKIDKPDANPQKVKDELLAHELIPEDLGGDVMVVEVSAQQKINLDKLVETILLQAEVLELKSTGKGRASGSVVESKVDKNKGVIATLLIQRGTLKIGDIVVAGQGFGKVKNIINDKGQQIKEAGPSVPVEVLGLDELPGAGDTFSVVEQEKHARDIIEYRTKAKREADTTENAISIDKLFENVKTGVKELNVIIKGDVQGSVEAIIGSLSDISNDEVKVKIVHSAAGGITESDITLAAATKAIILAFNVRAGANVKELAHDEKVDVRYYSIIYNLIDDMKAAVGGMMSPVIREEFIGTAEIQQVFKMSKYGKVAGCLVRDGVVKRGAGVRLIRDNVVVHEGKLKTLKRFKDEVAEVKQGTECGMAFENYEDIKEGDVIEAFEVVEEARTL